MSSLVLPWFLRSPQINMQSRKQSSTTCRLRRTPGDGSSSRSEILIEFCMSTPSIFLQLVEPGDVIRGHVVAKRHSGLTIQITSFLNSHKYRELSDLSIRVSPYLIKWCLGNKFHAPVTKGVVLFENLAEDHDKCEEIMRDMQLDDVVQGHLLLEYPSLPPCPSIIAH